MEHTAVIVFPNGKGYTPCSIAYRNAYDAKKTIESRYATSVSIEHFLTADYNEWNRLDQECLAMIAEGHTGKSVRY